MAAPAAAAAYNPVQIAADANAYYDDAHMLTAADNPISPDNAAGANQGVDALLVQTAGTAAATTPPNPVQITLSCHPGRS